MTATAGVSLCVVTLLILHGAPAFAEPAIGQFEVKDLDAEPGSLEFQSQNARSWGQPRRRSKAGDDEILFDENSVEKRRHALEIEAGITTFFRTRLGIEFEQERVDEPQGLGDAEKFTSVDLTELAIEGVFVFIPVKVQGVGLGLLVEYEHPTDTAEARTLIAGPIIEAKSGAWSAIANLTTVHFFGGEREEFEGGLGRDDKWDFAYAAQVLYRHSANWGLAVEAYGTVDRIGDTGLRSEAAAAFGDHDQHRMGPIVYYSQDLGISTLKSRLQPQSGLSPDDAENANGTLGAGLLFGLNQNTPDVTLKWSLEIEF